MEKRNISRGKGDHPVLNISYSDAVSYCEWLSTKYDDWTFRLPTEAEWENAAYGDYYGDTSIKYPNGKQTPSYNASTRELTTTFNFNGVIAAKLFKEYGSNYVVNYIKGDFAGASETLGECISISANGGVSNWANHGGTATKGYFLQTDLYAIVSADGGYTTPVGTYAPNTLGLYDMAGNCWDITSSIIVANNGLEQGGGLATQFAAVLGMLLQEVVLFPIEVRAEKIQLPQRLALELRLTIPLLMATIKA